MSINLKGRDFLTLLDFTPEEIQYLLDFSAELKAEKKDGKLHKTHEGKNIALIFEKSSTRTRGGGQRSRNGKYVSGQRIPDWCKRNFGRHRSGSGGNV